MNELSQKNDAIPTKTDKYVLTDSGKKLLGVLLNPEFYGQTVTAKCQAAGISRDTYYKLMKDDNFVEILNNASIDMIKSHVNDILQATLKFALKDPKCHSDRLMLLRTLGIVKDKEFDGNIVILRFDDN